MKLIQVFCSHQDKQVFLVVLQKHLDNYFPEGCGDSSLAARYALLDVIEQVNKAAEIGADHFLLNKRMKPFCMVALDNALEIGQIDQATFDRFNSAVRTKANLG